MLCGNYRNAELTVGDGGRMLCLSAPLVRLVTAKSVAGIGVLSVKRRPNRARTLFARFSYGRARGRAFRPATPFGGNANPARPATRDWRLRWLVNPVQTEVAMPENGSGRIPPKISQTTTDNAPARCLSRAERAAINRRATDVATMLFPYVRDYMLHSATDRLRKSNKLKVSALPMPPELGLVIARYRTFGVDGFDPRDPAAHRQVCSVGAAMTLVEVVATLREIADEITPETVLTEEGNDWVRDQIGTTLSGLLSIEIDAGLL